MPRPYAPTNAVPREEFVLFCKQLQEALALAKSNGRPLLVGTDLNMRLGGERDDVHIGPAVMGCQPADKKYRAEDIAAILASFSLAALTTMVGEPHTTWISPHESASQIDYVLGTCARLDRVVATQILDLDCFASDHSIVICELVTKSNRVRASMRIRPAPAPIRSPDHSLAVKLALANSDHSVWRENPDPLAGMAELNTLAKEVVTKAPGSKAVVKREWITAANWTEIQIGATIRRGMNRAWKHLGTAKLRLAWQILKAYRKEKRVQIEDFARVYDFICKGTMSTTESIAAVEDEARQHQEGDVMAGDMQMIVNRCALIWALHRVASRRQAKVVQKKVRADKLSWMQEQTDELAEQMFEGNSSSIHKQVKKCLLKLKPNVAATKRAPLKDSEGHLHTTEDEKQMAWQSHWAQLYGGKVMSQTLTFKERKMDNANCLDPILIRDDDWFTHAEVNPALRHQMNGKASIDGVPSRELVVILDKMAPVWAKAFNSFLQAGSITKEYRGTILFVIPKKVAVQSSADFRGLQLMLWSVKVFTRTLFVKVMQRIQISIGQFGLGAQAGIDYPLLISTQLMEYVRTRSLHVAWWFVDVRTAFDRIIRQLMVDPGNILTLNMLLGLGIEDSLAKQILRTVGNDRPILWQQGLSLALVTLLSSCLPDTWLTLPEDQGEMQLSTGLGSPQGSSLSGLLFILYQQSQPAS
eukprot:1978144-Amphidinium_carterae.3